MEHAQSLVRTGNARSQDKLLVSTQKIATVSRVAREITATVPVVMCVLRTRFQVYAAVQLHKHTHTSMAQIMAALNAETVA